MELESLLKQYFGYTSFRPGQHEVIQTLLDGRDCLAIMPTGAGKSICFQLPALMMPGVTLVISPLISLMKDQVDSLVNQEIPATYINSQCTFEEAKARFAAIRAGRVKLVYISPERLENEFFTSFMQSLPISMFIIDEAHIKPRPAKTLISATKSPLRNNPQPPDLTPQHHLHIPVGP